MRPMSRRFRMHQAEADDVQTVFMVNKVTIVRRSARLPGQTALRFRSNCGQNAAILMTSARLALIDARRDRRSEIANLLNAQNLNTVPLASLSEFEEAQRSLDFDLLVATVSTSHTGPVDFVRKIRKAHSIPLIILCEFDDVFERVIILEAGCDDVLFEPIHSKELIARARSVLRRARSVGDTPPR